MSNLKENEDKTNNCIDNLKKQLKKKKTLLNFIKIWIKGHIILEVLALIICLMIGGLQALSLWACYTIIVSIACVYADTEKNKTLKDIRKLINMVSEIEEKQVQKVFFDSKNIDMLKENINIIEPKINIENNVMAEVDDIKEEQGPRLVKRK